LKENKNLMLIIGSPRAKSSTSASLGNYLIKKVNNDKFNIKIRYTAVDLKSAISRSNLLKDVEQADILVLSFPLYVDSLPAPVIRLLDLIEKNQRKTNTKEKKFLAISNCGFPEAEQNKTAISICKQFCIDSNMEWLGGLMLGMGAAINGKPLDKAEKIAKNIKLSLELVAESILNNRKIPEEAFQYIEKPLLKSKFIYKLFGSISWRIQAFKNRVYSRLDDKPFNNKY